MPKLRGKKRKTEDDGNTKATAKSNPKREKQVDSSKDLLGLDEDQKDGYNSSKSESIQLVTEITLESSAKGNNYMTSAVMENTTLNIQHIPENPNNSFNATNSEKNLTESNQGVHKVKPNITTEQCLNNGHKESALTGSPVEITNETGATNQVNLVKKVVILNHELAPVENKMDIGNDNEVKMKEATCSLPLLRNSKPPQENHHTEVQELVLKDKDRELLISKDNDDKPESVDKVNTTNFNETSSSTDCKEQVTMEVAECDVTSLTLNIEVRSKDMKDDETQGVLQVDKVIDKLITDKKLERKNAIGFEKNECKLTEDCTITIKQGDITEEKSLENVTCPEQCSKNIPVSQGYLNSVNLSTKQKTETVVHQGDDQLKNNKTLEVVQVYSNSESLCAGEIYQQESVGGKITEVLDTIIDENGTLHMVGREQQNSITKTLTESKENDDSTSTQPFELDVIQNEIEKLTQEEIKLDSSDTQQLKDDRIHEHFNGPPVLEMGKESLKSTEPDKKYTEIGSGENVVNKSCLVENNPMSMKSVDLSESQLCELVSDDNFDMNMLDDEQFQEAEDDMAFRESLKNCKAQAMDTMDKMILEGEQRVVKITSELSLINRQLLKMKRKIEMAREIIAPVPVPQENRSQFYSLGNFGFFK